MPSINKMAALNERMIQSEFSVLLIYLGKINASGMNYVRIVFFINQIKNIQKNPKEKGYKQKNERTTGGTLRWINHKIAKKKRKEIGEQRKVKKKEEKPKKEIHEG